MITFLACILHALCCFLWHTDMNADLTCSKYPAFLPVKKEPFKCFWGEASFELVTRLRVESFAWKNGTLLNDRNGSLDNIIVPAKHTFDIAGIYGFGCVQRGFDIIKMKVSFRTKNTWGAPETVASTDFATIKDGNVVTGRHAHTINRNILWIRELWLEASLPEMIGHPSGELHHSCLMGLFPFQLGRGIALGDAYATDPDLLGYYSQSFIDQYAPGIKFFGDLFPRGLLTYDVYVAILNNKSNTFENVNMRVRAQEYGHRFFQARGFGQFNWLIAGRLRAYIFKNDCGNLLIEPYAVYDNQREQKIEFLGDASSKLGTIGFAAEAKYGSVEFGFDVARNFGYQCVKGWDRNIIQKEVRNGSDVEVNSQVHAIDSIAPDTAGSRALYISTNQKIINTSVQSEAFNGQDIGGNLRNSKTRFSDPYRNAYKGAMAVVDMTYIFCDSLNMSLAAGLATGDDNPNRDLDELGDSNIDGDYKGFIGLQENYSGVRVLSAFMMSGSAKVPRVSSFPAENLEGAFPDTLSRFTNLIYAGWSARIQVGRWNLNPNILSYWQEHASRIFDRQSGRFDQEKHARTWLGVEANLFLDVKLCDDIKLFFVGAGFLPGTFYADIKGLPLNKEQEEFLDAEDPSGIAVNFVPTLGNSSAFTFNLGIEYRF